MLKFITDTFRSIWPNSVNNTNEFSVGVKRKRNSDGDIEGDLSISGKRKKIETSGSGTFVNSISKLPLKMADWLRPKSQSQAFADEFYVRPVESGSRWGNTSASKRNDDGRSAHMNGDDSYLANNRFEVRHNLSNMRAAPRANEIKKEEKDEIGLSSLLSNRSSLKQNKRSTASSCIRLKEKEEYKKVLQLYSQRSPWQPPLFFTSSKIHSTNQSVLGDSDAISVSSKSSSADGGQFQKQSWSHHHVDSINRHKATPSRSSDLSALNTSSLQQTDASHRFSVSSLLRRQREKFSHNNDQTQFHTNSSLHNSSTVGDNAKKGILPQEAIVIDDDDDDENTMSSKKADSDVVHGYHSLEPRSTVCSFLQSKFMNDKAMEDERKRRFEEMERRNKEIAENEAKAKAYAEKRRAQEISLERELKYKMRIFDEEPEVSDEIFREDESEKEEILPELTQDMQGTVNSALRYRNPNEVLSEGFRLQITRRDMATLEDLNWLNDEIINFYMNMLMERGEQEGKSKVYAFNTFFYPKIMKEGHFAVKRWTKNVDIFAKDYIIIPVHLGMHWCLCIVNMKKKEITYYDSMGAKNQRCLAAVFKYLNDESIVKRQSPLQQNEWSLIHAEDNPHQMNGGDCGMFMCKYAEYITRDREITFTQENMPYFRRRMMYEIITRKLLQ